MTRGQRRFPPLRPLAAKLAAPFHLRSIVFIPFRRPAAPGASTLAALAASARCVFELWQHLEPLLGAARQYDLIVGELQLVIRDHNQVRGAQDAPQTVDLVKVDVQKLAAGYRSPKVVGSNVLNDANEIIGTIDDLLVSRDGKQPYAVLSIGGFLGMGTHLVVVPYDELKLADNKVILPGGTKEGFKMLPEFKYATG